MRVVFLFWRLPKKLIISYAPAGRRPRRKSTQTDPAWREASPSDNADYRRPPSSTASSRRVGCRRVRLRGSGGQHPRSSSRADSSTTGSSTGRNRISNKLVGSATPRLNEEMIPVMANGRKPIACSSSVVAEPYQPPFLPGLVPPMAAILPSDP